MKGARILIAEDEDIARDNLAHVLGREGYEVVVAANGEEAVEALKGGDFDLVLSDLRMPGVDGLGVLAAARTLQPECEVIMITGFATVHTAVEAMQQGAYHYLAKPYKIDELRILVHKALEKRQLKHEVADLRRKVQCSPGLARFIGQNPKIVALKATIAQIAQLDCNVLILGETGTGKELVARSIHELSRRAGKRYLAINCGAFSEDLIANELFGHDREAFTGAAKTRKGLLEAAEGGAVLFDEIGELPMTMQVKLLRVLQEKNFMRVGGTEEIPVDIRILAATNKDLKKEVEQGGFRQDLYYRLNVISLHVPPLSERRDDIPLLARHFLSKHAPPGAREKDISPDAMDILQNYEFPGNVRELENIIERALALSMGPIIEPGHLPADLVDNRVRASRRVRRAWPTLEENEKQYLAQVLEEVGGNKTKAAEMLAIDRVSLWRKLKRYNIGDDGAAEE